MAPQRTQQVNPLDGVAMKRREPDENKTLDLPRLPVRTTQERRPRLPPTLSGLYEPPPSAGLLPSISVECPQPANNSLKNPLTTTSISGVNAAKTKPQTESNIRPSKGKTVRNKWSSTETKSLLHGVARFGIGNWTKILRCADYDFGKRTALDLKDRFRVCCPDQYGHPNSGTSGATISSDKTSKANSARSQIVDLVDLGIQTPFARSSRRRRHAYTDIEDQQLLKGFQKYGKSWSSIQQDATLGLAHRTRTDLRDRMRTKYPQVLGSTGKHSAAADQPYAQDASIPASTQHSSSKMQSLTKQSQAASLQDQHISSWFGSDPYLSMAFDDAEFDAPITLDRGILDWPLVNSSSDIARSIPSTDTASRPYGNSSVLPSLATVTATGGQQFDEDREMLELPALAHYLAPPLDIDDRAGAHAFLSLEELLS